MMIARPDRALLTAGICTAASVLGGATFGYLIGLVLFEQIGQPALASYGMNALYDQSAATYTAYAAWAVLVAGPTPFSYKVVTILSGATGLSLAVLMGATLIARSLRFFVAAGLLQLFGMPIRSFVEERLGLVFTKFVVLLSGGSAALRVV